jgi:hypothetical protein
VPEDSDETPEEPSVAPAPEPPPDDTSWLEMEKIRGGDAPVDELEVDKGQDDK